MVEEGRVLQSCTSSCDSRANGKEKSDLSFRLFCSCLYRDRVSHAGRHPPLFLPCVCPATSTIACRAASQSTKKTAFQRPALLEFPIARDAKVMKLLSDRRRRPFASARPYTSLCHVSLSETVFSQRLLPKSISLQVQTHFRKRSTGCRCYRQQGSLSLFRQRFFLVRLSFSSHLQLC